MYGHSLGSNDIKDQLECTDPARNDFWELAGINCKPHYPPPGVGGAGDGI